jgi:hypothetical protein
MNDEIKLSLTPEEIQVVINSLITQPYQNVVGLIPKIISQANPSKEGTAEKPDLKEVK